MMRFASVCSGIEAASVAWEPLGWQPVLYSEIEPFPCHVLAYRQRAQDLRFSRPMPQHGFPGAAAGPRVPLWGDFTAIRPRFLKRFGLDLANLCEVLVAGTPCQDFSFAGMRAGLAGTRGNLTLELVRLAHAIRSLRWLVWENVPGVLSMRDNAFGAFLGGLVGADAALPLPAGERRWPNIGMASGPRARVAWRVLDAQHFGLAQRRRRVFVVAGFGDGTDPAAILFERQGLPRHLTASGEAGEDVAATVAGGARKHGGQSLDDIPLTAHTLRAKHNDPHDDSKGTYVPVAAFGGNRQSGPIDVAAALNAHGGGTRRLDFESESFVVQLAGTLPAGGNQSGGNRQPGISADAAGSMLVAHALRGEGFDASEDGTGRGIPLVPVAYRVTGNDGAYETGGVSGALSTGTDRSAQVVAFDTTQITSRENRSNPQPGDPCHPLSASAHPPAIAFSSKDYGGDAGALAPTLRAGGHGKSHANAGVPPAIAQASAVRRLTVTECERLQGFPDHHTRVPMRHYKARKITDNRPADMWEADPTRGGYWLMAADGPRYKALGNSKPVPVVRWIGERIDAQERARSTQ